MYLATCVSCLCGGFICVSLWLPLLQQAVSLCSVPLWILHVRFGPAGRPARSGSQSAVRIGQPNWSITRFATVRASWGGTETRPAHPGRVFFYWFVLCFVSVTNILGVDSNYRVCDSMECTGNSFFFIFFCLFFHACSFPYHVLPARCHVVISLHAMKKGSYRLA
jgi:hypothetical protein